MSHEAPLDAALRELAEHETAGLPRRERQRLRIGLELARRQHAAAWLRRHAEGALRHACATGRADAVRYAHRAAAQAETAERMAETLRPR